MLSEDLLTAEQNKAIDFLIENDNSLLVAPTGEGKTVICLTAIEQLMGWSKDSGRKFKCAIVCPPKVIKNFQREIDKWEHLNHLNLVDLSGDEGPREKALAANPDADIYAVSLNSLGWLLDKNLPLQGVIIDELSKAAGKFTSKLRHRKNVEKIWWRVGMTATPVSENFEKIFNMTRLVAGTKVFGNNKQKFMHRYFYPDYNGHTWTLRDGAEEKILEKIRPYVHLIEDNKVKKLPPLYETFDRFEMPEDTRELYDEMALKMLVEMQDGNYVEAANRAVVSGKLRQLASGFLYTAKGVSERVDLERLAAFVGVIQENKASVPLLVYYEYVEQLEEIKSVMPLDKTAFSYDEFDPMIHLHLVAQVSSMSHGVDGLQKIFQDIIFYQPIWSRDAYTQARDRVWRRGQEHPVKVRTLVCNNSLDEVVIDRVDEKGGWMELFEKHLLSRSSANAPHSV